MPTPDLRVMNGEYVLAIHADAAKVSRAFEELRAAVAGLPRLFQDLAYPPSRERREVGVEGEEI